MPNFLQNRNAIDPENFTDQALCLATMTALRTTSNSKGVAWITINRLKKMNVFRDTTCDEIIKALNSTLSI